MISLKHVKQYCKEYEKIENFKVASSSEEKWECHHRKEIEGDIRRSQEDLKALNMYYNVPPEDLIFLTSSEHRRLHKVGEPGITKGKTFNKESKQRMSNGKVQCIETGKIYLYAYEAEKELDICHINRACKTGMKAGGLHWKYV